MVFSLLKAQARGTSRIDLAMVKEQNEDQFSGDLLQSTRRLRRILLLERHISVRSTPRARTIGIGKSCRHTTEVVTFDHMSRCAAKYHEESSGTNHPAHARRVAY
jgi:hypothetical protein